MAFLTQALALISESPGSLVYHLLGLFSFEAALAFAVGQHGRGRAGGAIRLALAAGFALAVRLGLAILAGLGSAGVLQLPLLLPPLERAGLLITIMFMGWGLISKPRGTLASVVLVLGIVGVAAGLVAALPAWQQLFASGAAYNNSPPDQLWQAAQMCTLSLIIIMLVALHPPEWGTSVGMFAVLAAATAWQLQQSLQPQPLLAGSVPGMARLAELAALPLFALIVQRRVLQAAVREAELASSSFTPLLQAPSTALSPRVAQALGAMGTGTDRSATIQAVCEAAALALQADGAVLWEAARANPGSTRCSGGFYVPKQRTIDRFTVSATGVPATIEALMDGRARRLQARSHAPELAALSTLLGVADVRNALLAPLPGDGHMVRALMVYAPSSMQNWRDGDDELLKALAIPAAEALADSEDYQRMLESIVAPAGKTAALPNWLKDPDDASAATAQAPGLQEQVQRLELERSQLFKQLAAAPAVPLADDERAQLQAQVTELQTALDEIRAQVAGQQPASTQLAESATQLELLGAERELLNHRNTMLDQQLTEAHAQLAEQATALATQQAAADSERAQLTDHSTALQAQLQTLQAGSLAAEQTLQQLQAQAEDSRTTAAGANAERSALQAALDTAQRANTELQAGNAQQLAELQAAQAAVAGNDSERSALQAALDTAQHANTELQAGNAQQLAALQAAQAAVAGADAERSALQAALDTAQHANTDLQAGNAQQLAELQAAQAAVAGADAERSALRAALDTAQHANTELQAGHTQAMDGARQEAQQLQAALHAAQAQTAAEPAAVPAGADTAGDVAVALRSINDYSELMLDGAGGKIDVLQRKFLERIKCAALRADAQLDAHARSAALHAGQALVLQRTQLPALLLAAAAWARLQFADRAITFESAIAADLPEVLADAAALSAALHMLLLGAGLAGQPGRHVWFTVTVLPAAPAAAPLLQFAVRDANAPSTTAAAEPGRAELNPVLLHIATKLIEGHNGRLVATPDSGGGTLVMALLPAAPPA